MPFESEEQRKAMYAAAAGKSTLGIPKEVGEKFIKHAEDSVEEKIGEWLDKLELAEIIKPDDSSDAPAEPTLLSTPEFVKEDADPCWDGYEQFGMKEKDGKQVPNCVPDSGLAPAAAVVAAGCDEDDGGNREGNNFVLDSADGNIEAIKNLIQELKADEAKEPSIAQPTLVMPVNNEGGAMGRAAGIMFVTAEGEALMIRRGDGGDFPGTWAVPGGHQKLDETLEEAARREVFEETGIDYKGKLEIIFDNGQFCTYIARDVEKFPVKLNYESTGYDWCDPHQPPLPLHPGMDIAIRIATAKTEFDVAELIKDDLLPSPQPYANMHLLAIRITGTGLAYRSSIGEHVWRDPSLYINDDFLKRCNGLTVIMDHPETAVLDSEEFKDRAIGSIMLPYIKGDEVWGIAKVYNQEAMSEIMEGEISTSPSVVFDNTAGNTTLTTENGEPLLIEGVPFLLDHIAIVTKARGSKGVWDKGGDATGVLLNNQEVSDMNDNTIAPKADAQGEKLDALLNLVQSVAEAQKSLVARVDSMEKNLPAEPLVTAVDKRKDEDESAKEKAAEEEMKADAGEVEMPAGEIKPDAEESEEDKEEAAAKADEEEAAMCDAQAKADSVLAAFGKSASRPLQGENLMSYRKRLLRGLQAYSDAYKEVNLASIKDAALLGLAEKQIFADALVAAKSPLAYAADQLIEINEKDRAGRTITKFKGAMSAWLNDFKVEPMRATKFHTSNNVR